MEIIVDGYTVLIDEEDAHFLSNGKWRICFGNGGGKYLCRSGHRITYRFHRVVINAPQNMEVDHINGNTLDNRKSNLRLCDCSGNRCNCGKRKTNTSGYKGVSFYRPNGMWKSQIQKNKKKYFMGYHNTPELAYEAFKRKAVELHGEFVHF